MCGVYLKTPVVTRWNSTFDDIVRLNKIIQDSPEKIDSCMDFCSLTRFAPNEITFMKEYCKVMAPLATSLDLLQGDKQVYMGYLLPTLYALEKKMETP